jgi:hypothetical protein
MGLWPFATRGARIATELTRQSLDASPDYGAFGINDACVKLWLPERLTKVLDRLSAAHDASRPDVLRRLFFEHVYGREAFEELLAWQRRRQERLACEQEAVRFSLRRNTIGMFGKASEDFKLWLPSPLHTELAALARQERMGLSDYLRKTLVRILLGERTYHDWQRAIGAVPEEWRRHEASGET